MDGLWKDVEHWATNPIVFLVWWLNFLIYYGNKSF